MPTRLCVLQADITTLAVDAIVNAANAMLLGGGGVDGAIHCAADPGLLQACRLLDDCRVGEAKLTQGYRLPAKLVIHTIGPVWQGGCLGEPALSCYRNALRLANAHGAHSISFSCISTGIYGYLLDTAARVAIATVNKMLPELKTLQKAIFCCFSAADVVLYQRLLK